MNPRHRRGRNNNPHHGGQSHNQHHNRHQRPNRNQSFDSNAGSMRLRGTAPQLYDKYMALARDAFASGDRVAAENFFQHADHYFRLLSADGQNTEQRSERGYQPEAFGDQPEGENAEGRPQQNFNNQNQPQQSNYPQNESGFQGEQPQGYAQQRPQGFQNRYQQQPFDPSAPQPSVDHYPTPQQPVPIRAEPVQVEQPRGEPASAQQPVLQPDPNAPIQGNGRNQHFRRRGPHGNRGPRNNDQAAGDDRGRGPADTTSQRGEPRD